MSLLQYLPRSLLSQTKQMATKSFMSTFNREKLEGRRRILEMINDEPSEQCYKALQRSDKNCNKPRPTIKPECIDECDLAPLPMDLDHYTPSDKKTRKYQRTWCECYALPSKFVQIQKRYPKRKRRELSRLRATKAICFDEGKPPTRTKREKLIPVQGIGVWPCCKIVAPGCKPGKRPPSCAHGRLRSCCTKRRTQYPSFSECVPVGLLDPIPPCECVKMASLCDVFAYWRRIDKK